MSKSNVPTLAELVFSLFVISVTVTVISCWLWNVTKLVRCDFEPNYKCEILHTAGLVVPPASIVTVWFDDDEE